LILQAASPGELHALTSGKYRSIILGTAGAGTNCSGVFIGLNC
jgi:hypothetical protein